MLGLDKKQETRNKKQETRTRVEGIFKMDSKRSGSISSGENRLVQRPMRAEAKSSALARTNSRSREEVSSFKQNFGGSEEPARAKPTSAKTKNFTSHRDVNAHWTSSELFLRAPQPETPGSSMLGRIVDVSDRLLICSSSNMRNEVVVGGSDHALYAIDVLSPQRKPITMYQNKKIASSTGHCDWVTSVAHLADGRVLSAGMDGRLCLWCSPSRSTSTTLCSNSDFPISKVVTDQQYNVAISCSYDGNMTIWGAGGSARNSDMEDPEEDSLSSGSRITAGSSGSGRRQSQDMGAHSFITSSELAGHAQPVTECAYRGHRLASGDKGGHMLVWDLVSMRLS